ncbi:MAG: rRNA maturation RNase YbeY [Bacillota bacterium]|nr:rRNA maturation RNase YbeY [Bacillota bacterium]
METMIINQQDKVTYNKNLQKVIASVVNATAKVCKLPKKSEISILLVDNSYIQDLNFAYREQNKPTDVLSFAMNELSEDEPDFEFGEVNILGDIVISLERAQEQADEYGHSLERELGFLVAHGMLHLLGFDHESEEEESVMRNLQEKILQTVKLER